MTLCTRTELSGGEFGRGFVSSWAVSRLNHDSSKKSVSNFTNPYTGRRFRSENTFRFEVDFDVRYGMIGGFEGELFGVGYAARVNFGSESLLNENGDWMAQDFNFTYGPISIEGGNQGFYSSTPNFDWDVEVMGIELTELPPEVNILSVTPPCVYLCGRLNIRAIGDPIVDLSPDINTMTRMRFPINLAFRRSQYEAKKIYRRANNQRHQTARIGRKGRPDMPANEHI